MDPLASFDPRIRAWFAERFSAPTDIQARAWPRIAAGEHLLATAHKLLRLVASANVEHHGFRLTVTVSIGATLALPEDVLKEMKQLGYIR